MAHMGLYLTFEGGAICFVPGKERGPSILSYLYQMKNTDKYPANKS